MVWVLPTVSRPKQCAEALERIRYLGCRSKGIIFINGAASQYSKIKEHAPSTWAVRFSGENIGCLAALNSVFKEFPDELWYGFMADDEMLSPESPIDWEDQLIKTAGGWSIAHGYEDWNHGKRCQGYPIFGGKLLRAIGYWALPTTFHNFGLDSMHEWLNGPPAFGGGGLHNIICLPRIKIRHNRATPGLAKDECYKLADDMLEKDRQPFWDWCMNDLKPTADRVRKAMTE